MNDDNEIVFRPFADLTQLETIHKIEEVVNVGGEARWDSYDGFEITTDKQVIQLLISNDQSCCESWGYLMTEDDLSKFVGAHIYHDSIAVVDTNRSTTHVFSEGYHDIKGDPREQVYLDSGEVMFVDIKTTNGTLQFAAYNAHNGYYGHTVRIVSTQLTVEQRV